MIFFYLMIPIALLLFANIIETLFAKRTINKYLRMSEYDYINNLYGFYTSSGLKVNLPSTPSCKLEAYLMKDIIVISGTVNILWLFEKQMKPLIILRPNSNRKINGSKIQKIDSFKFFESRIRLDLNYNGVSKIQYTLGFHVNALSKDKNKLRNWFEEQNDL